MLSFPFLFDLMTNFYTLGFIQSIILAILLFKNKKNRLASKLLGVWLLLYSIELFALVALSTRIDLSEKSLPDDLHFISFNFFYGCLFYFYVRSLATGKGLSISDALHIIPITFCSICFYISDVDLGQILGIIYGAVNIAYLQNHQRKIKSNLSDIEKSDLNWLLTMSKSMLVIWISAILFMITSMMLKDPFSWFVCSFAYFAPTIWLFVLAHFGLSKPRVFHTFNLSDSTDHKYAKSCLKPDHIEKIKSRLIHAMETEKLYSNNQLDLVTLASKLQYSSNDVSQVINAHFQKNFHDFINEYRIEESKTLLANTSMKVICVGLESGFNSKSNFNKLFKAYTGLTPSAYRKKMTGPIESRHANPRSIEST